MCDVRIAMCVCVRACVCVYEAKEEELSNVEGVGSEASQPLFLSLFKQKGAWAFAKATYMLGGGKTVCVCCV